MDAGSYTIRDIGQLKIMAHPYRLRIMHDLARGKFTVTQLAEKYGDTPAKVHHHVKKLEKAGLVKLVETREVSGILEKYYQAVAGDFDVDKSLLQTAEAQESAADSIERMLRFVYARAKRGFERAVMAAETVAGRSPGAVEADVGAGPDPGTSAQVEIGHRGEKMAEPGADRASERPSGKQAGALSITYIRLKPSQVCELSSRLRDVVRTYEDDGRGAADRPGAEGPGPRADKARREERPAGERTTEWENETGGDSKEATPGCTDEMVPEQQRGEHVTTCCAPAAQGGGTRPPAEEEAGSYAVAIMIFPDDPSDGVPGDPDKV